MYHGTDAMNSRMASSVTIAKASLRKELKTRLSNMIPEDRQRQSNIITQKVLNSDFYKSSSRVCIYLSMDEEVNTTDILKHLLEAGKTCFIPRYTKTEMEMLRLNSWQDFQSLPLTAWNIRQPPEKDNREEALSGGGLDLMVVPGLGFTADGKRLGRGKGYYDRYLAKSKTVSSTCVTLGLAFSEQILLDIPTGEDDMKLDFVISEKD